MEKKPRDFTLLVDIGKWVVSTVIIGGFGMQINARIQENELRIKRMEADTKLLSVVTKGEKRSQTDSSEYRYLSFVKTFITTPEIKESVEERLNYLSQSITYTAQLEAEEVNDSLRSGTTISKEEKAELIVQEEKLHKNKEEMVNIDELIAVEKQVISNAPTLDSITVQKLSTAQKEVSKPIIASGKDLYVKVGSPITKWCKAGYFVEYSNSIRVLVKNIHDKVIEGEVKYFFFAENGEKMVTTKKLSLSEGEVYVLEKDDKKFNISLDYIGAAGKNPLTRAGYFTVTTYKKSASISIGVVQKENEESYF